METVTVKWIKVMVNPRVRASFKFGPYLLLQGILIISKHDLQILYALRISLSTSTKCLVHNSSFSLLYLQYPILDGFCNLSVKRFSASLTKIGKRIRTHDKMFHVDCFFLSYSMDPVNRYESVSKIFLVDERY